MTESFIPHSASDIRSDDFAHVSGIAERNFIGKGPLSEALRITLAERYQRPFALLTDGGAPALQLALRALRFIHGRRRSQVLTSAYVCPSVVSAIRREGLSPVFADTAADRLSLAVEDVAARLSSRVLAIVCPHVGGVPDAIDGIRTLGVPVISDACQAIGTSVAGVDLAGVGEFGVLSFGPTKMLAGGGGALLVAGDVEAEVVSRLGRDELSVDQYLEHGFEVTYGQHVGDLNAGIVAVQLARLSEMVARRRQIAAQYDAALASIAAVRQVETVCESRDERFNRFRYYFFADDASDWVDHFKNQGVDARRSVAHAVDRYHQRVGQRQNVRRLGDQVVSLPIYPRLTDRQLQRVTEAILAFGSRGNL